MKKSIYPLIFMFFTINCTQLEITYRMADAHDAFVLAHMRWDCQMGFHTESVCSQDEFVEQCATFFKTGLEDGSLKCWLAIDGDTIIAHAFLRIIPEVPKPLAPHAVFGLVMNVYTKPAYRNKKIGKVLMNNIIAWAKKNPDIKSLILSSSPKAIPFYERLGFEKEQLPQLMEKKLVNIEKNHQ